MNLTAQEKSLKDLLENMGPGSQTKQMRADFQLRALNPAFVGLDYDQAMDLYNENEAILVHTPYGDPAHAYLLSQRDQLLKLATALNDSKTLGRHDHEHVVNALVSVGDTTVQCNVYVPKLGFIPAIRNRLIGDAIRKQLSLSSDWAGSLRRPQPVDFVEL